MGINDRNGMECKMFQKEIYVNGMTEKGCHGPIINDYRQQDGS